METTYWNIQQDDNKEAIEEAAAFLRAGEVVAFPTETVYGLGADATNAEAVAKIFQAKGRPQDNPLIAHVATREQLRELVEYVPEYVDTLLTAFTPGPITFVLPSSGICAPNVTAGLSTVAIRIPDHPLALALIEAVDKPIAAPSANISGRPSPTTARHVQEDLGGKVAGIIDGGQTGVGLESTVLDCTQAVPVILRPGGITKEQLEEVLDLRVNRKMHNEEKDNQPMAPGMKYKHYSPDVPLWLVDGSPENVQAIIKEEQQKGNKVGLLATTGLARQIEADGVHELGETIEAVAARLYGGLRHFKKNEVDLLVCEAFREEGIGRAVMNRLKKAASKYIQVNN